MTKPEPTPGDRERIDALEQRLRTSVAHRLRREVDADPAWRKVDALLRPGGNAPDPDQNGMSSPEPSEGESET